MLIIITKKHFLSVMFELLSVCQLFGIFPCCLSKSYFTIKPILVATNIGIIAFLILIHWFLLTQTKSIFKSNFLTYLTDFVFLGISCSISHIILLSKRNALCKIINQIIFLRNLLPTQSIKSSYPIVVPFVLRVIAGLLGTFGVIWIDAKLTTQILILVCLFFYPALTNIVFLVLISELNTTLKLYNKCLKNIGPAFVYRRTFYLKCLLLLESLNQEFSVVHFLKVFTSFLQCIVSVNYFYDAPPESRAKVLFCMALWCIGYCLEMFSIVSGCLAHKKEVGNYFRLRNSTYRFFFQVRETAKLLEIMSLLPESEHLYAEVSMTAKKNSRHFSILQTFARKFCTCKTDFWLFLTFQIFEQQF